MYFPQNNNTQGWGLGAGIDQLTPQALSFNQGSLATPMGDVAPYDMSGINVGASESMGAGVGGLTDLGVMDYSKLAMGGLQTLGNLYMAFQANKLAKKQFRFQKDFANQNLANSIQSYNTSLEDRIRSRAVTEGRDPGYADEYLSKNKLADKRVG